MSYKGKRANSRVNALPVVKADGREQQATQATISRPPRRATQFTKNVDATKWLAAAVVLLVEKRTCSKCRTSYTAPSTELYIRLEAQKNKSLRSRIVPRKHVVEDTYHLPHETQEIETACECCQKCFQPEGHNGVIEPSLFPEPMRERRSLQHVLSEQRFREVEEEKKKEKPLSAAALRLAEMLKGD